VALHGRIPVSRLLKNNIHHSICSSLGAKILIPNLNWTKGTRAHRRKDKLFFRRILEGRRITYIEKMDSR